MTTSTTAPTDELTRIARDSQEAVTAALTAWTEAAERYATNFDAKNPLPSAAEAQAAVDTAYDLAAKLLAGQHAAATTAAPPSSPRARRRPSGSPRARAASPPSPPPDRPQPNAMAPSAPWWTGPFLVFRPQRPAGDNASTRSPPADHLREPDGSA